MMKLPGLDPLTFRSSIEAGAIPIDLRSPQTAAKCHIPGSVLVQFGRLDLGERAGKVLAREGQEYVLVIEPPTLGPMAEMLLVQAGFAVNGFLDGGVEAWTQAGLAVESIPTIDVEGLHQLLQQCGSVHVVDVRDLHEFEWGHIAGSLPLPHQEVGRRAEELAPDQHWYVICDNQQRSATACSMLRRMGHTRITLVLGGIAAWSEAGYPLARS